MSINQRGSLAAMVFVAILAVTGAETAQADSLNVVDNGATLTTTWDVTVVLTRNMDTGGYVHALEFHNMFADVFTSGNPQNEIYDMRASVNGGSDIVLTPWSGWNYRIGLDSPGNGWNETGLGLLWNPNALGGAVAGDTVRLFGSMTHDKGGFHHLPDFAVTTAIFSTYNAAPFSNRQDVDAVPEPTSLALLGLGLAGLGYASRRRKANVS